MRLRREIVAMRTEIGDRVGIAVGFFNRATGLVWSGEFAEAQSLLEEGGRIYDDLGPRVGVALGNTFLGWIDVQRGRHEQARLRIEESLLVCRGAGW